MSLVLAMDGGLIDKSVNRTAFSLVGGVVPGDLGYKHNGQTGYLLSTAPTWRSTDTKGTIVAWVRRGAIGSAHIILGTSNNASAGLLWVFGVSASDKVYVQAVNAVTPINNGVAGGTTISANQYFHCAVTSSSSTWKLYVNGVAETLSVSVGSNAGSWFSTVAARENVTIGSLKYNSTVVNFFSGDVDDLRVYNTEFTATELLDDYEMTRGR